MRRIHDTTAAMFRLQQTNPLVTGVGLLNWTQQGACGSSKPLLKSDSSRSLLQPQSRHESYHSRRDVHPPHRLCTSLLSPRR